MTRRSLVLITIASACTFVLDSKDADTNQVDGGDTDEDDGGNPGNDDDDTLDDETDDPGDDDCPPGEVRFDGDCITDDFFYSGSDEGEAGPGGGTGHTLSDDSCFGLPLVEYVIGGYSHGDSVGGGFLHAGDDLVGDEGDPVFAITDGSIRVAGRYGTWGTLVELDAVAPDGVAFTAIYGHLRETGRRADVGDRVGKGDLLGYLGSREENGGWSPHLHFSIFDGVHPANGVLAGHVPSLTGYQDPFPWMEGHGRECGTSPTCGNGAVEPGEDCDGANLNGATCSNLGHDSGTLSCYPGTCSYNEGACCDDFDHTECHSGDVYNYDSCGNWTSRNQDCGPGTQCVTVSPILAQCDSDCGNGQVDAGEDCDGGNLDGESCSSLGYDRGSLTCTTCSFTPDVCSRAAPNPGLNQWTTDFTPNTVCTCSPQDTDCNILYRGKVTDVNGNDADLDFTKAQNGGGPTVDVSYWVVTGGSSYPSCLDVGAYVERVSGTWRMNDTTLNLTSVPIWPSVGDFDAASCGDVKKLFIITGGAGYVNTRTWFQEKALEFTKECGP